VNPFRLEGQKSIMFRVLESLGWEVPDWIVVPGGNLGNSSAFGKAFAELRKIGLIDRVPRLAVITSVGCGGKAAGPIFRPPATTTTSSIATRSGPTRSPAPSRSTGR
jgi:threonine synthase